MRIAIHTADLDHNRIDGTRVYLFNMLKNFGKLDEKDSFLIYHRNKFNPQLTPPEFSNYSIKKISSPFLWTQTIFALNLFSSKSEVLWMPVQNMPILRRKNLKTVVTIHDLAFKIFPQHFTKKDLFKLNKLADFAIKNSEHIIAISNSTKNDIIRFYPKINQEKITVVHNGFDNQLFQNKIAQKESDNILSKFKIQNSKFLLYVGAIQPRKNLNVLIDAFEKTKEKNPDLKLVLAGAPAWKSESTFEKIAKSSFKEDIIVTGTISFADISILYQNALMFIFPSLYEGFGIPVLEAMASGVPVVLAKNSSLPEVGGEAVLYFATENSAELASCINKISKDKVLREGLIRKGLEHCKNFSWKKCAEQTLNILLRK
jgi:glycosyltransferase involved in cell wall biosynthesis